MFKYILIAALVLTCLAQLHIIRQMDKDNKSLCRVIYEQEMETHKAHLERREREKEALMSFQKYNQL